MTLEIALTLLAIIVLLMLSAFFNASETSLTAASRARMHALDQEGNTRARTVNRLLGEPEKMIGAVLLGNTLVDVLAAALASSLALRLVGEWGVIGATGLMTLLIVVFSAVLPKTYALAYADRMALWVAPIMRVLITILTPFTIAIQLVVRFLLKLTPGKRDDAANILDAHQELRGAIDLQRKEGGVAKGDAAMLGGILDLPELQVIDIMVHRTKMQTLSVDETPERIVEIVLSSQYSRIPVWKDDPDNIVGVLHTKDLLAGLARSGWQPAKLDIQALASAPWFVPDATSLQEQLAQFLRRKSQLALVVDEYGEVQGLITLEDILEEIVGQIGDEYDTHEVALRPTADGAVTVDGGLAIRDLNRQMDWKLPDDNASTVAGLVIHEAQTIPEAGQAFTFHGYRFEILRKSRNRITSVRVRQIMPRASTAAAP